MKPFKTSISGHEIFEDPRDSLDLHDPWTRKFYGVGRKRPISPEDKALAERWLAERRERDAARKRKG